VFCLGYFPPLVKTVHASRTNVKMHIMCLVLSLRTKKRFYSFRVRYLGRAYAHAGSKERGYQQHSNMCFQNSVSTFYLTVAVVVSNPIPFVAYR
jgi:hypothetical protein